jgi:hypothetical protein
VKRTINQKDEVKENYNIFKKRNDQEVRKIKYEKEALNVR